MTDLSWAAATPVAPQEHQQGDVSVQGSQEWLAWRGKGLGSSDAAVLLGWSPWKTIQELFNEKLGTWKPTFGFAQRQAMDRGKELEPKIREWYEQNHRPGYRFPDGIATDPERPHFRASFDGINKEFINPEDGSRGRIIEIKAPNKNDHAAARVGMVPTKYQPQVNWLMMVGQVPWADYVSRGWAGDHAIVAVPADTVMQAELKRRADLFWSMVEDAKRRSDLGQAGVWDFTEFKEWVRPLQAAVDMANVEARFDPKDEEQVEQQVSAQEVEGIVAEALEAQAAVKRAEAVYEALQAKLKAILGDKMEIAAGEGFFGYTEVKGAVDYKVIPELIGVDLEQYRKKPGKRFYLKRKGEK